MREVYRRFDEEGVDAIADTLHPDYQLNMQTLFFDGDVFRGVDGLRRWREDIAQAAEYDIFEPQAVRFGPDGTRYAVLGRLRMKGRASGVEIDHPLVHVFELRDGKVWRLTMYDDPDRALAAIEPGA
jgi:ketosteroid isomerase-like protein